jgi:hypothetical protein
MLLVAGSSSASSPAVCPFHAGAGGGVLKCPEQYELYPLISSPPPYLAPHRDGILKLCQCHVVLLSPSMSSLLWFSRPVAHHQHINASKSHLQQHSERKIVGNTDPIAPHQQHRCSSISNSTTVPLKLGGKVHRTGIFSEERQKMKGRPLL